MTKGSFPKHALIALSVLATASLLWGADKPWKGKPYQSWDAKDVQQIMTDSPWVARTSVRRSWHPSESTTMVQVQPAQQEISGGVRSGPTPMTPVASNTGAPEPFQQLKVYVYWYSSRVMRAASAREAVLHGKMDEPAVEKAVDAPQGEYEIVLRMDDLTPFIAKGADYYQQNAFLQMRRSKLKLPPSKVVYEHMGTTAEDVVFFFPKKTAGGAPTIASDETEVAFGCKIADQSVRVKFEPKKMVDQFGADL
jgi:hypothetical protein